MAAIDTTSYLKPEWKESYSLWVVPGGTQAAKLQLEIDTLREAHPGAPPFRAHVTVLSGISGPGEAAVAKAAKVAAAVQPYYVSFVNVTRGAIYFQCIYLLCAKDAKTMAAGAQARAVFGLSPAQPYMPHCSLLYSDMPQGERDAVVATSHQRLYGEGSTYNTLLTETGFTVDTIELWYTPGEDTSCASWAKVAEFPLAGSA
ncbi:hypothetical protein FOA52_005032 [Chlamydomonas sp. UWO 241]|nr:hypothetical protein FOA52_005032 [Chlamydomonas sp. UWO 241]